MIMQLNSTLIVARHAYCESSTDKQMTSNKHFVLFICRLYMVVHSCLADRSVHIIKIHILIIILKYTWQYQYFGTNTFN